MDDLAGVLNLNPWMRTPLEEYARMQNDACDPAGECGCGFNGPCDGGTSGPLPQDISWSYGDLRASVFHDEFADYTSLVYAEGMRASTDLLRCCFSKMQGVGFFGNLHSLLYHARAVVAFPPTEAYLLKTLCHLPEVKPAQVAETLIVSHASPGEVVYPELLAALISWVGSLSQERCDAFCMYVTGDKTSGLSNAGGHGSASSLSFVVQVETAACLSVRTCFRTAELPHSLNSANVKASHFEDFFGPELLGRTCTTFSAVEGT
jgi:hypothetical protein